MIRNVLVAVDGSEYSDRTLDFALDLAEKYTASVTVLNVSESPAVGAIPLEPTTVSGDNMVMVAKDLRKFHQEILNKAVSLKCLSQMCGVLEVDGGIPGVGDCCRGLGGRF